jgi:ABC-2 type transport system ATP-binding protein
LLEELAHVEELGPDFVRYRCSDPQHVNPQIIARLAGQGLLFVSLAEVPRSLEDVYLRIVAEQQLRNDWQPAKLAPVDERYEDEMPLLR